MAETSETSDAHPHGPSLGLMFGVFGALLALTLLTVGAAYQDLGRFSAAVALGIAGLKATLVVLFFMHLKYASRLIALYAASGLLLLAIIIGITISEAAERPEQPATDPLGATTTPAHGGDHPAARSVTGDAPH